MCGKKTFEFRKDDRDFQVGDVLVLSEWDPETQEASGEMFSVRVSYVARGSLIPDGFCVMSIEPCHKQEVVTYELVGRARSSFVESIQEKVREYVEKGLIKPSITREIFDCNIEANCTPLNQAERLQDARNGICHVISLKNKAFLGPCDWSITGSKSSKGNHENP